MDRITDENACADNRYVFVYAVKQSGGKAATTLPAGKVYGCKKIVKRSLDKPPSGLFDTVIFVLANITNSVSDSAAGRAFDEVLAARQLLRKV